MKALDRQPAVKPVDTTVPIEILEINAVFSKAKQVMTLPLFLEFTTF
jgi:hypothetical protein